MAVYIAKSAYFDTVKSIKILRVLPVDLDEIWQLPSTDSTSSGKNLKLYICS